LKEKVQGEIFMANKNWAQLVGNLGTIQYENRLNALRSDGRDTSSIEKTIQKTLESFNYDNNGSFVIFGEPQSGKTEMMIALNAKLIDIGCEVIVNLLNDSLDLLQQNLSRFRDAGLSPAPKQFNELPTDPKIIAKKRWIIFSKKNARDLEKLHDALRFVKKIVIIDDEADYASPNAKINNGERTKINQLIHSLLESRGRYIGVTATPARLDLNNTFENNTELWVDFESYPEYVGQNFFFPNNRKINYRLHDFQQTHGHDRSELKKAVFHFLCGVVEQHQKGNAGNFTMLVHTSGKTDEHADDYQVVQKAISILSTPSESGFETNVNMLSDIAKDYNASDPDSVVAFILRNIDKSQIVKINSKNKNSNMGDISKPKVLFSFGVGGNIISRGVTFENLLSMYFTRGVKGRFSQDTYIQRARMFGNRSKYKEMFQLWIPRELMASWYKCFIFHKLAIQSAQSGGAPVWLSDERTIPTSLSSVDRSSVDFEDGEMSFKLFQYDPAKNYMGDNKMSYIDRLDNLKTMLPSECLPDYIVQYIKSDSFSNDDICFHRASPFGTDRSSSYKKEEMENIRRTKGIFSNHEFSRGDRPDARHHLKIFYNSNGCARLFYKVNGAAIKFIQNKK
jgi:hypothetical protein